MTSSSNSNSGKIIPQISISEYDDQCTYCPRSGKVYNPKPLKDNQMG